MKCFPLDNTSYEAKDMGAYMATRTRGVFSAEGNLAVTPGASGMTVAVAPGVAWLKRADYWGVAAFLEQATTLQLNTADGALKRIDAIVCRLDKNKNLAEIVVKRGAYSSSPIVAAPVRNATYDEIYLATVLVNAGVTRITAGAITDQRLNETYCGLMRDGVTGLPTAQLQNQVQALIDDLRSEVAGIQQGSAVLLKSVYDPTGSGAVGKAERLKTARKIGNVNFDGSANITAAQMGVVPTTRTVAGKALSANITLTKSDVGLGNVNNVAALPLAGGTMAGAINMNGKRLENINPTMTFYNNTGGIEASGAGNRFYMGNGWYNFYGNDNITFGTVAAQISNQSSRTVKKNIAALDAQAAQKVLQLRPVEFDYKQDGKHSLGFIAQEVLELFPEVVSMQDKNNEDTWGLYETRLIAPLVKLCQEQQAQMDAQQALLEELQKQVAALQAAQKA